MRFFPLGVALLCVAPVQARPTRYCHVKEKPPHLADLQLASGGWDADAVNAGAEEWKRGRPGDDLLVTSLIAFSWLASERTEDNVELSRALAWIASNADASGWLGKRGGVQDHALATVALSEAVHAALEVAVDDARESDPGGLLPTIDPFALAVGPLARVARRATRELERAVRFDGGWSASGRSSDTLDPMATFWSAMALRSGLDSRLIETAPELERAAEWFRQHADPKTGIVGALGMDLAKATLCGLMVRSLAGEKLSSLEGLEGTLARLIETWPAWRDDPEYGFLVGLTSMRLDTDAWRVWDRFVPGKMKSFLNRPFAPISDHATVEGTLASSAYFDLTLSIWFRFSRVVGVRQRLRSS
jgi:hypothetical protein